MKGIRKRKSGNFEVRIHRNGVAVRLGTYGNYEDAVAIYKDFESKNEKMSRKTHGMRFTPIYKVWQNMISRCYNKNTKQYHRYGVRGISVCGDWLDSFESFYSDMKDGYSEDLQIDRIDNNGGYCKDNCRWVSRSVNCANKSNIIGVRKLPSGRFFTEIKIQGTKYSIGTFDTKEQAILEFKKIHRDWYGF